MTPRYRRHISGEVRRSPDAQQHSKRSGGIEVRKGWVKWICGASVIAVAAAWAGAGGAGAQSAPAPGGAGTNGNAAAAKLVKNDPLAGAKGSGLTRGVTSSTIKVGCYLQAASFANADDGFKARFNRANK